MERWMREREGDLLAHIEDELRKETKMNTPFETKLDSMILEAEYDVNRAKKQAQERIQALKYDLERALGYIEQDQWRSVNSLGIVQQEGVRIDTLITEVHGLRLRLSDLEEMRDVALAAIKSAKKEVN